MMFEDWQKSFLGSHQLDNTYLSFAKQWIQPLAISLAKQSADSFGPILLAVNGCQGSGKTTLCNYLAASIEFNFGLKAVTLSLDDFYYPRDHRLALSRSVHPLLATRGVPGTHDMTLLCTTLDALLDSGRNVDVHIPSFDKAIDDRRPKALWGSVSGAVDVVILEGWCMGVTSQREEELLFPVNALEEREDPHGEWRRYVNECIEHFFIPLYSRVDKWLMLQAPSFDSVFRWRLQQEQKLAKHAATGNCEEVMNEGEIARFIQHYQRLTEHCLRTLPATSDYLLQLDENRQVIACRR